MDEPVIPLSILALDVPIAADRLELDRRGIQVVADDLGRLAISRDAARLLLEELRLEQERKAQHLKEVEAAAVAADQAFRATLPRGIRADGVPAGLTPIQMAMLSDPMGQGHRRETVLEHSLQHRDGAIVYHPINEDAP